MDACGLGEGVLESRFACFCCGQGMGVSCWCGVGCAVNGGLGLGMVWWEVLDSVGDYDMIGLSVASGGGNVFGRRASLNIGVIQPAPCS